MTLRRLIPALLLAIPAMLSAAPPSAAGVMEKAARALRPAAVSTVRFRITGSHALAGKVVLGANGYFLDAGDSKVWYDGREMTTLNLSTGEATVTRPTPGEADESNPFSYISSWRRSYSVAFAPRQPKDAYCLVLTARNGSAPAPKAVLTVARANFQPRKLVISHKGGGVSTVAVVSVARGGERDASGFVYPAARYPRVRVVDLR